MHYHVCILINFKTLNRLNMKKKSSNKNKQIYLFMSSNRNKKMSLHSIFYADQKNPI